MGLQFQKLRNFIPSGGTDNGVMSTWLDSKLKDVQ